jgi:hypothetical protein
MMTTMTILKAAAVMHGLTIDVDHETGVSGTTLV